MVLRRSPFRDILGMLLYLIRHGESVYNVTGRIQGQMNVPLSELGHRQAAAVAEGLADVPLDALYASPLDRARDTARPIAERLQLTITFDDRLQELNAGVFQGLEWDEIATLHPVAAQRWRNLDPDFAIPGGESRSDLMRRAAEVLSDLHAKGGERIAIVSHGGWMGAALKHLLDIPAGRNPFLFANGSITRYDWGPPGKLLTLNETEHLRRPGRELPSRQGDL